MIGTIRNIHESTLPADAYQPRPCTHPDLPPTGGPVSDEPRAEWRYLPVGTRWTCPDCGSVLVAVTIQGSGTGAMLSWMNAAGAIAEKLGVEVDSADPA